MVIVRKVARKNSSGPFKSVIPKKSNDVLELSDTEKEELIEVKKKNLIEVKKKETKKKKKSTESKKETKNGTPRVTRRFGSGKTAAEEIAKVIIENGNKPCNASEVYDLLGERIHEVFPNDDYFYKNKRQWFIQPGNEKKFKVDIKKYNVDLAEFLETGNIPKSTPRKSTPRKRKSREIKSESEEEEEEEVFEKIQKTVLGSDEEIETIY